MNEKTTHPLAGNPYTDADGVIDAVIFSADDSPMQTTEVLLDQLKSATLAVAFEQRTANLIALYNGEHSMGLAQVPDFTRMREAMRARLGLDES